MGIYLKYEGVDGPITVSGRKGWIELESFEFDVSRQKSVRTNGGGEMPKVSGAKMTKLSDCATSAIMREALRGTRRSDARVHFVAGEGIVQPYLEFDFDDVFLAEYSMDAVNGSPVETFVMLFARLRSRYTPEDAAGKLGAPIPAGYDLRTGTPL